MRRPQPDDDQPSLPLPSATVTKEIVRVEKNLNTFGYFTPSSKRVRSGSKRVALQVRTDDGRRVQAKATIFPVGEFGLPTTADQDKYFAFQKIVEQIRKRNGYSALTTSILGGGSIGTPAAFAQGLATFSPNSSLSELLVFNQGKTIASGRPQEVVANPQVIEAYLGRRHARAPGVHAP